MRIEAGELRRIQIPLRRAFKHALADRSRTDAVLVTLFDAQGRVGWGEIQPRPYVTGESVQSVLEASGPTLARNLLGKEFPALEDVLDWLREAPAWVGREVATLCGFDVALLDLAGRAESRSVADLMGGERVAELPAGVIVGFEHKTEKVARYCATLRLSGKRHVKVKVGAPDDLERLRHVAKVFKDLPIRLDANAAWTADLAIEHLRQWSNEINIHSIEQPIAAEDHAGLRRIREETGVKVMADESLCTLDDAARLIEGKACDIFNVRLGKNGGLWTARRLVELAQSAGMEVHLGTMVGESGILSRAAEVFGRCVPGFACLDGKGQNAFLLELDILEESGEHPTASEPGLGLRISQERIKNVQVGPTLRFTPSDLEST